MSGIFSGIKETAYREGSAYEEPRCRAPDQLK